MICIDFLTSSERREFVACMRRHGEDHGVARRANAILLLDDGKSCQANAEFLYLDDDTIRGWLGRPFDRRLERRSVLHDCVSRDGALRLVGRTLLSIHRRDQGAYRGAAWRGLRPLGLHHAPVPTGL
ncbi:MAG: hypothetical protein P8Q92_08030 [Pseudoprimorskyibacter sp.]|nr:hypothetical protein [Pseudoprimorskyibacter sp.]